jgi:acyl-CoA synthetase (AMP-forming)/AMP-acid ligase II
VISTSDRASEATVPEFVRRIAAEFGPQEAVVLGTERLSYTRLESESSELARALLAHGLTKGSRIGIWLGNGPRWIVAWAAVCRAGGIAVPLSTLYTPHELARAIRIADLQGLIVHEHYRGRDAVAALEDALPELAQTQEPQLQLEQAPYLRWISTVGTQSAPWLRTSSWLVNSNARYTATMLAAVEREVHPSDPCMILFTSGTTSDPKAILHTHDSVMSQLASHTEALRFEPGTRVYTPMPFFWLAGQIHGLFPTLIVGGTVICSEDFVPAEILQLIADEHADRVYMTKSQAMHIMASSAFASSDRSSIKIGFPTELLPANLPVEASARLAAAGRYMGLGMSETYGPYWYGAPPHTRDIDAQELYPDVPPLSYVPPGFEVKILDAQGHEVADGEAGEICVRGRGLMLGMCKRTRQATFDNEGFYHTGDGGLVQGDLVYFRGRINDLIKTAGANVSPEEVERAMLLLPGVTMAVVVGIPHSVRGQDVAAAVVLEANAQLTADDLRSFLRARLSRFMVPRHIVFFDRVDIPLTASQRVRRGELAATIVRRLADQ